MKLPELGKAFVRVSSKMGRPSKLNEETQEYIVQLIKTGNYVETAAAVAGVKKDTLYEWLRRGARQKRGRYRTFRDAVLKALAHAEAADVAKIRLAAEAGDWRASCWRLERKNRKHWGQSARLEHSGPKGGPIQMEHARAQDLTDDELARIATGGGSRATEKAPGTGAA